MKRLIAAIAVSLALAGCGAAATSTQTPAAAVSPSATAVSVPASCLEALELADDVYSLAVEAQGIMVDTRIELAFGAPTSSEKNKLFADFETYADDLGTASQLYREGRDDCRAT